MSATSRTLLTELQVDNSEGRIRIGSYAQVRFGSVAAAPALTLPSSALIFRSEGLQVGIVDAQGVVELRNVELGRDFGQRVEILSGVTAADKVIATPSTHSSAAWPSASLPPPSHSEWADFRDHRRVDGENLDRLATSRFQITPPCVSAPSTPSCGWWPRTKVPTNGMCLPRSDERVAARAFRGSGRMRRIVFRKRRHISSVRCR
jgi:hypothetical protein